MKEAAEEWLRLSPLTIAASFLRMLGNLVVPIGFALFALSDEGKLGGAAGAFIGGLPLLVVAVAIGLTALAWSRRRYCVGEADIRYEQGLVSRSARSVPFERIQDVSLEQKLLARLLGLVEVRFETGAGGKDELKLSFVSQAEGERLREVVRERNDTQTAQPDTPEAEEAAPREDTHLLFAMDLKRLITFGMFEFSLVVFAVLLGAAQQFEFLIPPDLIDYDYIDQIIEGRGAQLAAIGFMTAFLGALGALAGLICLGFVTGIVRTVLRDFDFRLERNAKGFRRRRGLLTKTDVVMPVHRVQALRVTTGFLRRLLGWHGLSFISLAQDNGSSNHDVAPFAQMAEIAPIVQEAGFALPGEDIDWHRPAARYYMDRAVIVTLLVALVAVIAIVADYVWLGLAMVPFGAFMVLCEYWLWRHDCHALDTLQLLVRRGWFSPQLVIASRVKLHSAEIARGPLARWRGYASLHFGLAGGRLRFRGLTLDQASRLRKEVLDSVAAVDFAALPR